MKKYRTVELNEVVQKGDEYLSSDTEKWITCQHYGATVNQLAYGVVIRRPIYVYPPKYRILKADEKINVGRGYRKLKVGETIKEGDEYNTEKNIWFPTKVRIGCYSTNIYDIYRRKIAPKENHINKLKEQLREKTEECEIYKQVLILGGSIASYYTLQNEEKEKFTRNGAD